MVDNHFYSPTFGKVSFDSVIHEISSFICRDPKRYYKVIIGSDSPAGRLEPFSASIITAVIVWRVGRGGIYFLTKSPQEIFYTRRDRIIRETMNSLMLAQELRSHLKKSIGEEFLWDGNEIHADVGNDGETREYIKEVTGLIKGYDFVPVIKPDAWGAMSVADKYT